jgi:orotate phosphoribosyltransferase
VLVIEDLISTGGSSLKAVETLREAGCEVVGILAIFSYGFQKATDVFEGANCSFGTLSNYNVLVEKAVEMQYISPNDLETLKNWRESPTTWGLDRK